ncbi:MAG TPA: immunoglobulin-like domain-containing protein, partial [Bacteroidales bacterium]
MKKIKYIIILLALTDVFLSGCKKNLETEGLSKVTYYPEITMNGDATVFVSGGTAFNDPGATATANGQPITVTTPVVGDYFTYSGTTVDVTKSNRYFINYTAVNSDGFAGSVTRTVYVAYNGDLVNSIEGLYTSTVVRNGASSAQYTNMEYVMIRKTGTNTYE